MLFVGHGYYIWDVEVSRLREFVVLDAAPFAARSAPSPSNRCLDQCKTRTAMFDVDMSAPYCDAYKTRVTGQDR